MIVPIFNYRSAYQPFAGKTTDWLSTDTAEKYLQNLKDRRQELIDNGWIDNYFTYKFNSRGFRCEEFTTDPTIMFLGCSLTCGIGLPVETIWPEQVSKELNMRCANLGQAGGSADTAFRLCHGWIDQINPKIVVFLQPPGIRWEVVDNNNIEFLGRQHRQQSMLPYIHRYIIDDNNNHFNKLKNQLAIESICASRKIKYLKLDAMPDFKTTVNKARDLVHPGSQIQDSLAKEVLDKLNW
jgi:hypothetical protein